MSYYKTYRPKTYNIQSTIIYDKEKHQQQISIQIFEKLEEENVGIVIWDAISWGDKID